MAINRFFKPVDYEYTPIPFQELVTLGKYYADERKQAEKDLANYIKSANEFTSLLSKDVDTYNKTAFNDQIKSYINQAASNPSVMKDMGWRSGLQAAMNAVDYGMLNKLKSSAESAKTYNTAVQKLAMEGKMYPGWEPNYFDTYSTEQSGVFNATPLAWASINDDVHPYVDNLKEALIRKDGNYNIMGVSRERVIEQVDKNMSEIMTHPRMQRRLQYRINSYEAMGKTAQEAYNDLVGEIYTAAMEKAWEKPEVDKLGLLALQERYRASRSKSGKGDDVPENKPSDFTVNAQLDTAEAYNRGVEEYTSDKFLRELDKNPVAKKAYSDLRMKSFIKGKAIDTDMLDVPEIKSIYDRVYNGRLDAKSMFIDTFNKNAENGKLTAASINSSSRELLDRYSKTIQNAEVSAAAQLALPNKEGKGEFVTTGFGSNIKLINSKNLQLTQSYMFGKTGKSVESMDPVFDKLNKDLRSGKFKDVIVRSANNLIQIPEEYKESSVTCNYTVSIPKSQFSEYTDEELQRIGAIVEKTPDEIRETYRQGNTGQSKTQTIVPGEDYVTFEVTSDIDVDGLNAEYLNAAMHKETLGISASGKLHPDVQYDAYSDDLNDDVLRFLGN